jgi:hypothetical protein
MGLAFGRATCSIASKEAAMKTFHVPLALIALEAVWSLGNLRGAELQPAANSAWQAYVRSVDTRMQSRLDGTVPFLAIDAAPATRLRVRNGAIVVEPVVGNGTEIVPDGLIHHWVAAAFIPHVNVAGVLRIAHDYAEYKQFYHPSIMDSRLLGCEGGEQSFSTRSLYRVLFVTAVLDSQFVTRDVEVDATRWYIIADSTRVQEVENYGRADEHVLPPDQGRGFIWRLRTITRYEERDGGVYVEMEAIALSRDIPPAVRWLVGPAVSRFSQNELATSLRQTREAVNAATPEQAANYPLAGNSLRLRAGGQR